MMHQERGLRNDSKSTVKIDRCAPQDILQTMASNSADIA
jgi:hypothetical protein